MFRRGIITLCPAVDAGVLRVVAAWIRSGLQHAVPDAARALCGRRVATVARVVQRAVDVLCVAQVLLVAVAALAVAAARRD